VIKVESENVASVDGTAFAPTAAVYDTTHKAADIFQVVLLGLGHA
jgi:hypothetical protein